MVDLEGLARDASSHPHHFRQLSSSSPSSSEARPYPSPVVISSVGTLTSVIRRGTDAVSISDDKVVITTVARMDVEFMLWAITEAEALYRDGWRVTGFARDPSDGSLL